MRLREYEYILAIAREQNMSRAAESLHVSQPALSRLLTTVEEDLGQQLFLRRGRDMVPTSFGSRYIEQARELVEMNARFEQNLRQNQTNSGEIRIAMPLIYSDFLVNYCSPVIHEQHPQLKIISTPCYQWEIKEVLMNQVTPLALGIISEEYDDLLNYKVIGTQEMILAVPAGHPLIAEAELRDDCTFPYIAPEKLAGQSFILPNEKSHSRRYTWEYFRMHGISPKISLEASFTLPVYRYVAESRHLAAILPSVPARFMHLEDRLTYLSLSPSSNGAAIGIMYTKNHDLTETERELVAIMREQYKQ